MHMTKNGKIINRRILSINHLEAEKREIKEVRGAYSEERSKKFLR